jgi:NADPH:quinone reductase-like Zn-dependent oxidoreductase
MKAAQVVKYGDAVDAIELREVPEPAAPNSGEALVGVEVSPINFNDLMVLRRAPAYCPKNRASITRAAQDDWAQRHSPADYRDLSH